MWPAGCKYKSMASRIFFNASWRVLPCDQQLFSAGPSGLRDQWPNDCPVMWCFLALAHYIVPAAQDPPPVAVVKNLGFPRKNIHLDSQCPSGWRILGAKFKLNVSYKGKKVKVPWARMESPRRQRLELHGSGMGFAGDLATWNAVKTKIKIRIMIMNDLTHLLRTEQGRAFAMICQHSGMDGYLRLFSIV